MAFTLNRRLSTLVASNGQLNTGKIPNGEITTAMLHSGFTVSSGHLGSIDSDAVSEGSSNLYFTNARVDSRLSGGTGVTYSSGAISIGQAVATTDNVTFADLTVTGNLTITGDIDSYNVTDLDVTDKTITIGKGQSESNSGGSGLIVDGASASILWDESNDEFDINKGLNVTGDLVVDTNTLKVDATNNRVGIGNASPDVSLDIGSFTDAIHVPVGTTGQRPTGAAGYFRYNTTTGGFEGFTDEWGAIAGGGSSAKEVDNFTGDNSTTAFTLSSTVADEDNLMVFIDGVYQNKADFVASGTTLTLDTAPIAGRKIAVHHVKSSISGTNTILDSFTANGSTTAFTLSLAPGSENNTQIFIDGVYQQKTDYTVSGTTLTFDTAPANGAIIEVMIFTQTVLNQPAANTVGVSQLNLSDGSSGQAIVTDGSGTISFADVGIDGIVSSANATAITIDSSENVGIGNASPGATLDVKRNTNTVNNLDSLGFDVAGLIGNAGSNPGNHYTSGLRIYQGSGTVGSGLGVMHLGADNGTATTANRYTAQIISPSGMTGGITLSSADSSGTIKFATGGYTERMRIDSAGVVHAKAGLGAAPITSCSGFTGTAGYKYLIKPTGAMEAFWAVYSGDDYKSRGKGYFRWWYGYGDAATGTNQNRIEVDYSNKSLEFHEVIVEDMAGTTYNSSAPAYEYAYWSTKQKFNAQTSNTNYATSSSMSGNVEALWRGAGGHGLYRDNIGNTCSWGVLNANDAIGSGYTGSCGTYPSTTRGIPDPHYYGSDLRLGRPITGSASFTQSTGAFSYWFNF